MHSMNKKMIVLALGAVATVCTAACNKSSDTERKEADKAEVRAEEKTTEVRKEAAQERNEYLTTVRREQLDLRGRLQGEIDDIDKKLLDLKVDMRKDGGALFDSKSKDAKRIQELIARRERLVADANLVDRADERGWDETKATVEKDLKDKSVLPGKT